MFITVDNLWAITIIVGLSSTCFKAKFYIEVLGFQLDKAKSIPGVPVLKSDQNISIILYLAIEKNLRNYPRDTGPLIVFEVENILKTKQEWEAKGVKFIESQWAEPATGISDAQAAKLGTLIKDMSDKTSQLQGEV